MYCAYDLSVYPQHQRQEGENGARMEPILQHSCVYLPKSDPCTVSQIYVGKKILIQRKGNIEAAPKKPLQTTLTCTQLPSPRRKCCSEHMGRRAERFERQLDGWLVRSVNGKMNG